MKIKSIIINPFLIIFLLPILSFGESYKAFSYDDACDFDIESFTLDASCYGNSNGMINTVIVGPIENYIYNWSNGESTSSIVNLIAGQYILSITNEAGCETLDTFIVSQPEEIIINLDIINTTCSNDNGQVSITSLGGTAPYQYSINGINFTDLYTFNNLAIGSYTVLVKDRNNCFSEQEFQVEDIPSPLLNIFGETSIVCPSTTNYLFASTDLTTSTGR